MTRPSRSRRNPPRRRGNRRNPPPPIPKPRNPNQQTNRLPKRKKRKNNTPSYPPRFRRGSLRPPLPSVGIDRTGDNRGNGVRCCRCSAFDDEIRQPARDDDYLHDVLAGEVFGDRFILLGRLLDRGLIGVGGDFDLCAELAVHLHELNETVIPPLEYRWPSVRARMSPSAYAVSSAASRTRCRPAMIPPMHASAKTSAAGPRSAITSGFGTTQRTSATITCRTQGKLARRSAVRSLEEGNHAVH